MKGWSSSAIKVAVACIGSGLSVGQVVASDLPLTEEVETEAVAVKLSSVKVEGAPISGKLYTSADIENKPGSYRDISSLLIDNPAVRFDADSGSSLNRGSMSVEEISIHGSSPFQNFFSIDGFGATNNLDPAEKNTNLKPSTIPSNSQAYFLDTALLDSVAVYDKNIPIEYGGFTGGVVDARLKRAGEDNKFRISYGWTGSNLTQQKIANGYDRLWEQGWPGYSPDWRKKDLSISSELRLTEKIGLTLSGSRRKSDISRYHVVEKDQRNYQEKSRFADQVDNILAKFSYAYAPQSFMDVTLKYSDRTESLVSSVLRDTAWNNKHDAKGIGFSMEHYFESGSKLALKAGWDYMGSHQNSTSHSLITHMKPGLQTYTSGGYGKNEKSKDLYSLGLRYDLAPKEWGNIYNTTYFGADLTYSDFRFKRHQDSYSMIQRENSEGVITETNKTLNKQGNINKHYSTAAVYMGNSTQWQNWTFNLGVRIDHDDLFENTNISPRVNVEWDLNGDGKSLLSIGRSRYYGHSILNLALQEEIDQLSYLVKDRYGNDVPASEANMKVDYSGLKSPYDDEWAVSYQQELFGFLGEISYVKRHGRQQVTREKYGNTMVYSNDGRSKNDSIALSIQQKKPWQFGNSYWTTGVQFDWQKTSRSSDYEVGYDGSAIGDDVDVYYNGERMAHLDMPVSKFYQPKQLSFNLNAHIPTYGVKWTNTWRWRSKKQDIVYVGMEDGLESYESAQLSSYWLWDTKLMWKPPMARGAEVSVEVSNVLNKMPEIVASNPYYPKSRAQYRSGREFRLQFSYEY